MLQQWPKLAVMGFVSSLCRNHLPRKEGYWMPLAQIVFSDYPIRPSSKRQLALYASDGIAQCINLNPDIAFWIKMVKNWGFNKRLP